MAADAAGKPTTASLPGAMPFLSAGIARGDLPASVAEEFARAVEETRAAELRDSPGPADPISDEEREIVAHLRGCRDLRRAVQRGDAPSSALDEAWVRGGGRPRKS